MNLKTGMAFGLGRDRIAGVEHANLDVRASTTVIGTDGVNDIDVFGGGAVILRGGGGDDVLFGADLDDRIHGGRGDDVIYGNFGDDTLDGGVGTDKLEGGPGTDTCIRGEVLVSCP